MNRFHSAIILILAIAPQCEKAAAFQPPPSFFPSVISSSVLFSSTDRQITKKIDDAVDKVVQKPVFQNPIGHTVLPLPLECYDESVVCFQRATNTRIRGLEELQRACRQWDRDFVDELSGDYDDKEGYFSNKIAPTAIIDRISRTSPTTLVIQWNVSYVPPTVQWLPNMAQFCGWTLDPRPYNDQSGMVKTFSYKAVVQLLLDAVATQKLRIPLACIEGTTVYECSKVNQKVVSMTEDLSYAQDLQRQVLQNRLCGQDLQYFLESARRQINQSREQWEERVANSLPWSTVPGLTDPLAIEPMNEEEEQLIPALFLGTVVVSLLGFAYVLAPELIGQNLLGPPSYIVPPQELNNIISY
jgi:hypothetical protein